MGNSASVSALEKCISTVGNGRVGFAAYPSNPLYQISWVKPYNLDISVNPAAVVRPQSAQDIAGVIQCAATNNAKVQAKSGGHSYGNYGLGGADGVVAIDMVNFQDFSMDNTTWQATIGAGTLLGDVTTKLHNAGGRAIAHGVCPGVGLGGHATIGGLGPMSRMWGSCLDHVLEVEVVTADGKIQRASSSQNADLFWALKGSAAGFGVITNFVVRTHPEPGSIVQYSYTFRFGSQAEMAPVYQAWQDLIADPGLDRRFGTEFIMMPLGCIITGTFYGTEAEYAASGIPARLPKGGNAGLVVNDWVGSLTHDAQNEALYLSNVATPFYSKSLGFKTEDLIPADGVKEIFQWVDTVDKGTLLWFIIFDATGGAVSDVAMNATAYAHRDKVMFYQSYAVGLPLSGTTKDFLTSFHKQVLAAIPAGTYGTYAGYVDPALTDGQQEYWGTNLPALEGIKLKWDPSDIFHNPQSVRPASP
ncbi:FAD-binding domain-containing protein [Diplogelasinospora grovesii]|uniref:FAD-binding domain-containing protein n=1 Tax=Diplogelasinospora grovesii TaxID=303347 RepID=A0AAN6S3Y2_9PEZI|nr:FAD-binding domain-containing protein [Diplogelasinospora grovesii]